MAVIESGFSETADARRAVDDDRKKAKVYIERWIHDVWVRENRAVTASDLHELGQAIADGKHAK